MSADSIPLLDAHTQFLALQKRVDDQEKQIGSLQRSLCCTLRLLGNLKRTEELVKLLPPPPLPSPTAPFPKVVENPEALLSSVEDLREKKSETACRVLFAVFFPHLQDVRSRFEKKKTEIADLVGKWSVFCAGRGDRKRADWLSSLSPEEVRLFKALTHHELPTEWKVPVNPVEGKCPPLFPVLSAYASRDFFSFCKLLLLNPNPSRLAQQLMVPVLLGRPGALSVPSSGYSNAPFEDILPSLNLIAPIDANFLSFRSHALAVLWNAALGSPKLVGVKELCRWLATASHVADSETVERVAALGSAKGRKVARQIENFLHRSGGRVNCPFTITQMQWRDFPSKISETHFGCLLSLPKAERLAVIASQANRVWETTEAMRRFLRDSQPEEAAWECVDLFNSLRTQDPHMADAQVRSPRVFWYADHIESRVTEFQLAHRHRDPEQLIDVRVERHIFGSRGLEEPPDPAMMPRAIDAALLRACATGLPRTIETLLKYGANPRVNFVGDERDSSVRIPAGCDPFCRSAVIALQRISGLGVRLAADFTRHFACARNVLRGGGDPRGFLDHLAERFPDLGDVLDETWTPPSKRNLKLHPGPLRLQPRFVRLRVIARLCAEASIHRGGVGSKIRSWSWREGRYHSQIRERIERLGVVLCARDAQTNLSAEPPADIFLRVSVSVEEMLLLDRSLANAWRLVQRWGLRPSLEEWKRLGLPLHREWMSPGPESSYSLCESLFLGDDEDDESSVLSEEAFRVPESILNSIESTTESEVQTSQPA